MSPQPPDSYWFDQMRELIAAKHKEEAAKEEKFNQLKERVEKLEAALTIAKLELNGVYRDRNDHLHRIEELERRVNVTPSAGRWLLRYFQGPQGVPGVRGEPGPKGEQGEPGRDADAVVQSHDPSAVARFSGHPEVTGG